MGVDYFTHDVEHFIHNSRSISIVYRHDNENYCNHKTEFVKGILDKTINRNSLINQVEK